MLRRIQAFLKAYWRAVRRKPTKEEKEFTQEW
jgi:preprotein translocase subunit Sss1